ncbi:MAG: hypothetical protein H6706_30120 [Myxococcales bacterium]|nr:hypothetical protein [Myxococcales bacterium]
MQSSLRPPLRLAPVALVLACGGAPVATPPPPGPPRVLVAQAPRLGETLARLSDWSGRFGVPVDLRQLARLGLTGVLPGARLDGAWTAEVFAAEPDVVVVATLPGEGPVAWQAGPAGEWEMAFRALGADRIVVTTHPLWVDAHADWLAARTLPGADVDLLVEMESRPGEGVAGSLPPGASPDASPEEQWLDARVWDVARQVSALRVDVTVHPDRLEAGLQVKAVPGSALAGVAVPTLSAGALAHAPRGADALIGLHLPPEAWATLDQVARVADRQPPEAPAADWRARLMRALGGELMAGLVVDEEGPSVLGAVQAREPAALAALLAELGMEQAFEVASQPVWRLPIDVPGLYAASAGVSFFGLGPGSDVFLTGLLSGHLDTGIQADGDLADAWRRAGPGTCCVAMVDLARLKVAFGDAGGLGTPGPPILLVAGGVAGALTVRVEVPAGQLAALLGSAPEPPPEPGVKHPPGESI